MVMNRQIVDNFRSLLFKASPEETEVIFSGELAPDTFQTPHLVEDLELLQGSKYSKYFGEEVLAAASVCYVYPEGFYTHDGTIEFPLFYCAETNNKKCHVVITESNYTSVFVDSYGEVWNEKMSQPRVGIKIKNLIKFALIHGFLLGDDEDRRLILMTISNDEFMSKVESFE